MERFFRNHSSQFQAVYDALPVPIQNVLASVRGFPLARNRYSSSMYDLCDELRSHEAWSYEDVQAFQLTALEAALDHARATVPYYRNYPALKWESLDDIRRLPVITREDVRKDASAFLSLATPAKELILVRTTGTTGASLTVGHSTALMKRAWAFHMRHWSWFGVKPGDWRITLFGSRVAPPGRNKPPFWAYNLPEHQILMSVFHLSERTADDYITFLHQHEDIVLEGFPSVLAILADFILERGECVPMRVVFTDGEPLYGYMREKIEAAFHSKIYDTYGNTELCGLIQQCEHFQMHLAPEWGFVEILNERNEPVAAGEEGFFVWTSLGNRVMPLVRYRIGDRGCWQDGTRDCGRAFPLIRPTITRDSDLLRHPDGRIFSPRALNQLLKAATSLRFCQFVQDRLDHVIVRGVPSLLPASGELDQVCKALRHILGDGMGVSAEVAPEPITRAGGKIPLIFSAINSKEIHQRA